MLNGLLHSLSSTYNVETDKPEKAKQDKTKPLSDEHLGSLTSDRSSAYTTDPCSRLVGNHVHFRIAVAC